LREHISAVVSGCSSINLCCRLAWRITIQVAACSLGLWGAAGCWSFLGWGTLFPLLPQKRASLLLGCMGLGEG
jgi:hypothetical protein